MVMSSSPFLSLSQSLQTKQHTRARNRTARSARLVASPHSNHVEPAVRPQTGVGGGTLFSRTLPKYDRYAAALQSNRQRAARPNRILFNLPTAFSHRECPGWVKTPRSPRVSATSEPEGKPDVIDTVPGIPTPMSGVGWTPVVPESRLGRRVMPSRPGELHPEPLTEPDVILSHHPAHAITRRLPPSAEQ